MVPHPLLLRQLAKCGIVDTPEQPLPPSFRKLLERVSAAYREGEEDRYLLERSLTMSSAEMMELNGSLRTSLATIASYRAALDQQAIIAVTDLAGTITEVNEPFCRISKYTREELIGANHRIVGSGTHSQAFWQEMWRTVRQGGTWRAEVCNKARDGSLYWVDTTIGPMRDAGGKITGYIAVRQDISERKRSEQALRSSHQVQEEMGRIARVGGWEFEPATGRIAWSRQMYDIFEVTEAFRPILDVCLAHFPGDARDVVVEHLRRCAEDGLTFDCTVPFVTATGRNLWVRCLGKAERVDGRAPRLYGAFQDVTEWHQRSLHLAEALQAAEAASQAKDQFLANMSHEIRTPMTAILGYVDILRDEGDLSKAPPRRLEVIDTIRTAGTHLTNVINDILDLSKIEAGRMTIESVATPLLSLLREVESIGRPLALSKGIGLTVTFDEALPEVVFLDATRLKQILMNLVGNAVKFTAAGGVTISTGVETRGAGKWLLVHVTDTGIGLTAEQAGRLFAPFTQADNTMSRRFGGTGLGLALSRHFARLMGGDVTLVQTTSDRGSCFCVELPLEALDASAVNGDPVGPAALAAPPVNAAPIRLTGRILFAEDTAMNRRLVAHHLERAGAAVETAEDGRVALEMLTKAETDGVPYDLLLTDMQMPVMDGYTLARTLRERGATIAIVALTAHAMAEDRDRCLAAGCDDYAVKPIDRLRLIETCARWMGRTVGSTAVIIAGGGGSESSMSTAPGAVWTVSPL